MRVAAVADDGSVVARAALPTPQDQPCAGALLALVRALPGSHGARRCMVGVPGRVDHERGALEHAPNLPPGWASSLSRAHLSEQLEMDVSVANDADLAAVGEYRYGAGRGSTDMVDVTFSTGVGAGVVLGGRLLSGRRSLAEVGHTVLDLSAVDGSGTAEARVSGTAFARYASAQGLPGTAQDVLRLVGPEPAAVRAWARTRDAACAVLVDLSHLFCPDRVVVGGGLGRHAPGLVQAGADAVSAAGPAACRCPSPCAPRARRRRRAGRCGRVGLDRRRWPDRERAPAGTARCLR